MIATSIDLLRISVFPNKLEMVRAAANEAADRLIRAIQHQGRATFVAATGASQIEFLKLLATLPGIAWSKTCMFHLDEYIGIPETHPASFRKYLKERLVDCVQPGEVNFIKGDSADPLAECSRLNGLIARTSVDVAFVGIGENGHLAFNDPPADFEVEQAFIPVKLNESCRKQQLGEGWFNTLTEVPEWAITMSIQSIMKAKSIVCSVPDRRKAQAVRDCFTGEISPDHPASILRNHPNAQLFLDNQAASLLNL